LSGRRSSHAPHQPRFELAIMSPELPALASIDFLAHLR
jgi:hypothetical protein